MLEKQKSPSTLLLVLLTPLLFDCTTDNTHWIPRESLLTAIAVVEDGTQDIENRHISTVRVVLNEPLLESPNTQKKTQSARVQWRAHQTEPRSHIGSLRM